MSALLLLLAALPTAPLAATDGQTHSLAGEVGAHPWTVVVFFSRECPVMRSHDGRLRELATTFSERGVGFVAVDAQSGASLEQANRDVQSRGYSFPLVVDPAGTWADALEVRFSTTVVVLDARGRVRYRGGFDDQRVKVSDDFKPLLRAALEALLAGGEPVSVETKALGCVLRRP
jgi:peroxiredoxin